MKKSTAQTRKTWLRKKRQSDAAYLASLRRHVGQYECYGDPAKMSKEKMEAIVKRGKRRLMVPNSATGMMLALAAMGRLNDR